MKRVKHALEQTTRKISSSWLVFAYARKEGSNLMISRINSMSLYYKTVFSPFLPHLATHKMSSTNQTRETAFSQGLIYVWPVIPSHQANARNYELCSKDEPRRANKFRAAEYSSHCEGPSSKLIGLLNSWTSLLGGGPCRGFFRLPSVVSGMSRPLVSMSWLLASNI